MIAEHDLIVLLHNLPDAGLQAGDVGTVVHCYATGAAYEVEFGTLDGQTIAVVTVAATALRPVNAHDMLHARALVAQGVGRVRGVGAAWRGRCQVTGGKAGWAKARGSAGRGRQRISYCWGSRRARLARSLAVGYNRSND